MEIEDATALIEAAVPAPGGVWADLGAGSGVFSRALAGLLGPAGLVYAVDRDAQALRRLERAGAADAAAARVVPVRGDFLDLDALPELKAVRLDGILLANALHFVAEPGPLLAELAARLRPAGRLVVVEYGDRPASRWVPFPVPEQRLRSVVPAALLSGPEVVGTRPSRYGGVIYAAVARRREAAG